MANQTYYVELGLACANMCTAIDWRLDELSPFMIDTIERLMK